MFGANSGCSERMAEIEIFLHFARRPDELAAFMASDPALQVQLSEDTAILRSQGIWAAMQFSKEIHDGKAPLFRLLLSVV